MSEQTFVQVTARAVHSVKARGFHERSPAFCHHSGIMAQALRLAEETGELMRAIRQGDWPDIYGDEVADSLTSEVADVFIVLANLAYTLGVEPRAFLAAVEAKLAADEARGYLHRGEQQ